MTVEQVEKYVGVRNVDKHSFARGTYIVLSSIRTTLAMWGVGGVGAKAALGGTAVGLGMGVAGVLAPIAGLVAVFCALGFPAMKAKEIVSKKAALHGYAIGVVLAAFGYSSHFASTFIDNTSGSPGVAPSYMTGIYKKAYNAALCAGYSAAGKLTPNEKNGLTKKITEFIIADAQKGGYKINMDAWTDREWVHNYARTFNNQMR